MYDMTDGSQRTAKTIRIREEAYHLARVAAVTSKKSLGQWLEEAIVQKIGSEEPAAEEAGRH